MDIAIRSGYSTLHPFQSSQYRSDSKLLISFFHWFHTQIIFAEQIDRTCSPGMTQTLAIRTAVHGKMLRSSFFRVVFFPERGSTLLQHTAPISFHFLHDSLLFTQSTKSFQFIKTHIRRCDFQNAVIQKNRVLDGLLLICVQILEEYRKHIGITRHSITLLTIHTIMHKCLFLIVPESRF